MLKDDTGKWNEITNVDTHADREGRDRLSSEMEELQIVHTFLT